MISVGIGTREYILTHGQLSAQKERGDSYLDNFPAFEEDLKLARLDDYRGDFIAYQKGILCGHSKNGHELYETATSYYGGSSLAVFRVPMNDEPLESAKKNAFGRF